MEYETYDQSGVQEAEATLREAMSQKKSKHRVEIRKKHISTILRSKRIECFLGESNTNEHLSTIESGVSNSNNTNSENDLTHNASALLFSSLDATIEYLLESVNSTLPPNFNERAKVALRQIQSYIVQAIYSRDADQRDRLIHEFTVLGGGRALLHCLSLKDTALLHSAIQSIGNLFALSNKPILNDFFESSIINILLKLLETYSSSLQSMVNTECQAQDTAVRNLISEILRALANMASEGYQYRVEIIKNNQFLQSEIFIALIESHGNIIKSDSSTANDTTQHSTLKLLSQAIFFLRNLVGESPYIEEKYRIEFIPQIKCLFLNIPTTSQNFEFIQECCQTIKSYAKYGSAELRSSILSNHTIFEKLHAIIGSDIAGLQHEALLTLKEFMRHSDRQTSYVFKVAGLNTIVTSLHRILASARESAKYNVSDETLSVYIAAIEVLSLYIVGKEQEYFDEIFTEAFELIQCILQIGIFHPKNSINYVAKEFLFCCIQKANYAQQTILVQNNVLQVIVDTIQDDDKNEVIIKALRAMAELLTTARADEDSEGRSPVERMLEGMYQMKDILGTIQAHPNNNIHAAAIFILDNFFQERHS